jgi:hypothetical protein
MFRKIRSNRNPRDTLYSELKKELSPYLAKLRLSLKAIAQKYPRFLFAMMCINIMLSVIVVISIHQSPPKKRINVIPLHTGFDKIERAGEALRKTIILKTQVDSIMAKKTLSPQDSAVLESALDQLQKMKKQNP